MKRIICLSQCIVLVVLFAAGSTIVRAQNNSIIGMVFDASTRRPVPNINVELLNDVYATLKRARTDGSGRFLFNGLSSGEFKVKVLPYGTNYLEEMQDATIINISRGGSSLSSDRAYIEFYLKVDKRRARLGSPGAADTVFVQSEIPNNARKLYEKGITLLDDKKDSGLNNIKQAIDIFPAYYDALDRLGVEFAKREKYAEAAPYLIKAIDVNQRSFSSFYWLGITSYNLKHPKEAMEALRAATVINPQSINAQLWYGIVSRIEGSYETAEKALLKAKTLAKETPISQIHWQLALLYNKIGRYKQSAEELESFLKLQPDSRDAVKIRNLIAELRSKIK